MERRNSNEVEIKIKRKKNKKKRDSDVNMDGVSVWEFHTNLHWAGSKAINK